MYVWLRAIDVVATRLKKNNVSYQKIYILIFYKPSKSFRVTPQSRVPWI